MSATVTKAFWTAWGATTMLNGIVAGHMVSHSVMLGQFFNWFIQTGNLDLLHRTYSVFRASGTAHLVYDTPFYLHLAAGTVLAALALVVRRHRLISVLAGMSTLWAATIFHVTDLDGAEDSVLTGTADAATIRYYLDINIPVHAALALIYLLAMAAMLAIPLLERRREALLRQ